jgi:hypothetical protein
MRPSAAAFVFLLAPACAVETGRFVPTSAQHPASPDAQEAEIRDPGKSLAVSRCGLALEPQTTSGAEERQHDH